MALFTPLYLLSLLPVSLSLSSLGGAGGIPPLGLAGFQGKYRRLSSVLEAGELSLSTALALYRCRFKGSGADPEPVTFPTDSVKPAA